MTEIDPRVLPDPEPAGEPTPQSEPVPIIPPIIETPAKPAEPDLKAELENLKTKNLELQKQKEHWREKYERDIIPSSSDPKVEEAFSDEGKMLQQQIKGLQDKIAFYETTAEQLTLLEKYPMLKDQQTEFNEFVADPENHGIKKEKLARLFLLDKGLLTASPERSGLEKPTAGAKAGIKSGLSNEEVKRLRETQPRRYQQMLKEGRINPADIY